MTATHHELPIGNERISTDTVATVQAPYDGRVIGTVPQCDGSHVDLAVASATAAFKAGGFPAHERAAVLDRAAAALATPKRHEHFARLVALEAAKPITAARGEIDRAVQTLLFSAVEARTLSGEVINLAGHPAGEGRVGFTMRVPIGVVAAITPFNFPVNLVAHKIAPAIAAGCPVVLKVASQTPISGIEFAKLLLDECGLPAGWLNVVTGPGSDIGPALTGHPDVALITFTGSPPVGWAIRESAPRKRVNLELGNNSPVIIESDADLDAAVTGIVKAGYSHAGQSCISVQRVFAHVDVYDEVERRITEAVADLVVGDPLDEATDVSSLISTAERDRVAAWIDDATANGARLLTGGTVRDDGALEPAVLADVAADMEVAKTEVFGPLVGLQRYTDLDGAIARANDTRYGLHAGIFTCDIGKAMKAAHALDFGGVIINDVPTWRADNMPYGGLRDSGNTREGPAYAVREMTEIRTIVINT